MEVFGFVICIFDFENACSGLRCRKKHSTQDFVKSSCTIAKVIKGDPMPPCGSATKLKHVCMDLKFIHDFGFQSSNVGISCFVFLGFMYFIIECLDLLFDSSHSTPPKTNAVVPYSSISR